MENQYHLSKAERDDMIKEAYDRHLDQGLAVRTVDRQRQINYRKNGKFIAFDVLFPNK